MTNKNTIILIIALLNFCACSDIIVPDDIEDNSVKLITPADDFTTSIQTHTFSWEEIGEAEGYNLKIVSPDFDNPEQLILDSNIIGNNFTLTLSDNTYQWRVVGYNEVYESMFEIFDLLIQNDSTDNLSNQIINLQTPGNNLCTKNSSFMFLWDELLGADQYIFQIGNQDFTDLRLNVELTDNFFEHELIEEGEYFWRVRGESQSSQTFTSWSSRKFTIDLSPPSVPVLNSPSDGATLDYLNQDPDLEWLSSSDATLDSLFIYSDEFGDSLLFETALGNAFFNLEDSSIDFSVINFEEDYFWQLNSTDKAGNTSELSELRVFYIQE